MKAGQAKMQLIIRCVKLADPFMSVSCLPNLALRAGNGSSYAETSPAPALPALDPVFHY